MEAACLEDVGCPHTVDPQVGHELLGVRPTKDRRKVDYPVHVELVHGREELLGFQDVPLDYLYLVPDLFDAGQVGVHLEEDDAGLALLLNEMPGQV